MFTLFNTRTPKLYADIDRAQRREARRLPPTTVFATFEVYLGSTYVNDFNYLGRTYHVTAQADGPFRQDVRDIANYKTRNDKGEMVPIGSVATFRDITGPYRVARYDLYPAAEIQGNTAPGDSTGQALAAMERLAPSICRTASAMNGPSSPIRRSSPATPRLLVFGASRGLRLPGARGAI